MSTASLKSKFIIISLFFIGVGGVLPTFTQDAAAWNRTAAWNATEQDRKNQCNLQAYNIFGAVWINDTSTGSTAGDRWDEGVTVAWNATTVDVTMWTTAFTCSDGSYTDNARIINLAQYASSPVPISFPYGTDIFRGDGNPGTFTDRSSSTAGEQIGVLRVRINVSGRGTGCYSDVVQFTGQYADAGGVGLASVYRQNLCLTRLPPPWTASGNSTVSAATAIPGSVVTFRHYVHNNGPSTANIGWGAYRTSPAAGTVATGGATAYASGQTKNVNNNNFTIPAAATAGTQYCQRVGWTPLNSTTGGYGYGTAVCTRVVYDYTLTPSVTVNPATTAMVGTPVTFTHTVSNVGTRTNTTNMGIRQIIIPPGVPFPAGKAARAGASCATYTGGNPLIQCLSGPAIASTTFGPNETRTVATEAGVSTSAYAPGTQVCRTLYVNSYTEAPAPNIYDSVVTCTVISKAPYLAIVGSDASAGGSTTAPYTGTGGFYGYNTATSGFGSFGEYAVLATGPIADFSTAGRIDAGNYRTLMFANTPIGTSGNFQTTHRITDYVSRLQARGSAGSVAPNVLTLGGGSQDYREPFAGDISLSSANPLAAGRKYLIFAPGRNVTITSNIEYAASAGSFAAAPSVIIVANNIQIQSNVSRVDAVLYAVNAISTCAEAGQTRATLPSPATPISVGGACELNQLKINGAAIGRTLYTPRVNGGANASQPPAEVFVLRPEAFLEPYESNLTSMILKTDVETELPPRN